MLGLPWLCRGFCCLVMGKITCNVILQCIKLKINDFFVFDFVFLFFFTKIVYKLPF